MGLNNYPEITMKYQGSSSSSFPFPALIFLVLLSSIFFPPLLFLLPLGFFIILVWLRRNPPPLILLSFKPVFIPTAPRSPPL